MYYACVTHRHTHIQVHAHSRLCGPGSLQTRLYVFPLRPIDFGRPPAQKCPLAAPPVHFHSFSLLLSRILLASFACPPACCWPSSSLSPPPSANFSPLPSFAASIDPLHSGFVHHRRTILENLCKLAHSQTVARPVRIAQMILASSSHTIYIW